MYLIRGGAGVNIRGGQGNLGGQGGSAPGGGPGAAAEPHGGGQGGEAKPPEAEAFLVIKS